MSWRKAYTVEELNIQKPERSVITVTGFVETTRYNKRMVSYVCQCGKTGTAQLGNVVTGKIISCGCVKRKKTIERNTKYIGSNKKISDAYWRMISRCYDPDHVSYHNYGGRGVVVCDEWINDKQKFIDWALANGWKEGLELDKDIRGNGLLYSPATCSWVTREVNQKFKRNIRK